MEEGRLPETGRGRNTVYALLGEKWGFYFVNTCLSSISKWAEDFSAVKTNMKLKGKQQQMEWKKLVFQVPSDKENKLMAKAVNWDFHHSAFSISFF